MPLAILKHESTRRIVPFPRKKALNHTSTSLETKETDMYSITGITGNVGGALARALLAGGHTVRAVVRDADKGRAWAERGCEVALAEMQDPIALTAAFEGADGVFVLPPSEFDPRPGFPEARAVIDAVKRALQAASPAKVVCLSTIGAQSSRPNLLTQRTLMEQELSAVAMMSIAFLRPAWFMENAAWDVAPARDSGVIHSFLQPLSRAIPMVATADVGRITAELMLESWAGRRIVELEGPKRVSPLDIAASFAKALGRPVDAVAVPHQEWEALFRSQGARDPTARIQMLDGFNEGWIDFAGPAEKIVKGHTTLDAVIRSLTGVGALQN
jgi:NAD(P)H dehydrogenase (quinone)